MHIAPLKLKAEDGSNHGKKEKIQSPSILNKEGKRNSNTSFSDKATYTTYTSPRISPLHNFEQITNRHRKNYSESHFPFSHQKIQKRFDFNNFPEVIEEDRKEEEKQVSKLIYSNYL